VSSDNAVLLYSVGEDRQEVVNARKRGALSSIQLPEPPVQEKNHRRTVWNKMNPSCITAIANRITTTNFMDIRNQRRILV
jgi:hypothetical protein